MKLQSEIWKKWDGVKTLIEIVDGDMWVANDRINEKIKKGELPPVESEHREYYIMWHAN